MDTQLPVGKLPLELLARLLTHNPIEDPQVLVGPGVGMDCAVLDFGPKLLVLKSDPITFATDEIGWYLVQVNANDLATTGATPRWLLVTALLPEKAMPVLVEGIYNQIQVACRQIGVSLIGGHTEITYGLDRPILSGTLIGEVDREALVTPRGANIGDKILLTKGVPVEATAILARQFPERLEQALGAAALKEAQDFLYTPGISVLKDARLAQEAAPISAMHDPTEGGLAGALWELAEASGHTLTIRPEAVPVPALSARICEMLGLDPLAAIASGALLLTTAAADVPAVRERLESEGILCAEIGVVESGPAQVLRRVGGGVEPFTRPLRDEIARFFEENDPA